MRLVPDAATARRLGLRRGTVVGRARAALVAGRAGTVRVKLTAAATRAIKRVKPKRLKLTVSATEAGKRRVAGAKTLTVRR